MHEIEFVTPYKIPASKVQNKATDQVSFIQIEYVKGPAGSDEMKNDLGMGLSGTSKIPCKAIRGLTPVTGFNVNCTFTVGASPTIEITNY